MLGDMRESNRHIFGNQTGPRVVLHKSNTRAFVVAVLAVKSSVKGRNSDAQPFVAGDLAHKAAPVP